MPYSPSHTTTVKEISSRRQADLPVPLEKLDDVRVTIFREPGQEPSATTDHFKTENVFKRHSKEAAKGLPPKWLDARSFRSMP